MKVMSMPPAGFKVFSRERHFYRSNGRFLGCLKPQESRVLLRDLHQKMSVPGALKVHNRFAPYLSCSVSDNDGSKIILELIERQKHVDEMLLVHKSLENVAKVHVISGENYSKPKPHSQVEIIYSAIKRAMKNVEKK